MNNKFEIKNIKRISLIVIIIILLIINLNILIKFGKKDESINSNENNNTSEIVEKTEEQIEREELKKLKAMTERDRMEFYFSKFISYIKEEQYEKAYNLLYPEFKEKYFKTLDEFKYYAKKTYSRNVGFSYSNIDRQGSIYVLMITVIDASKTVDKSMEQRIVIKENDFNDFVLSFQVI